MLKLKELFIEIIIQDLKPENILLTSKDEDAILKLSDFGFAKHEKDGLFSVKYSLEFAPPEILKRESTKNLLNTIKTYDKSCDIWSLGVIMYVLCYSKLPFSISNKFNNQTGIKKRIKNGLFLNNDSRLTQDARLLINGMIEIIPENRLTIEEILRSNWIRNYKADALPDKKLKNKFKNSQSINILISSMLNEIRFDDRKTIQLKNLNEVSNPLLRKRLNKNCAIQEKIN